MHYRYRILVPGLIVVSYCMYSTSKENGLLIHAIVVMYMSAFHGGSNSSQRLWKQLYSILGYIGGSVVAGPDIHNE